MRYTLENGVGKKGQGRWVWVLVVLCVLGGLYVLYNTLAPALPDIGADPQATAKKLQSTEPAVAENRLYMPQINVDVPIVEIEGDETAALDKGAIHRAPSNGNPKEGGNFVIAAHRFTMGLTPALTRAKSPFYHIDKMSIGDQVYVDYEGIRYAYKITEKKRVAATAVEIEDRTAESQLTVYSCELSGARDGREVLLAKLVGKVTLDSGQQKIKTEL